MFNRFSKIVLVISVLFVSIFGFFENAQADGGMTIDNFDLNPKTIANPLQATFQMTLRVTMNVAEFNAKCGNNTNSFVWRVTAGLTPARSIGIQGTTQINRTSSILHFNLDEPFRIAVSAQEASHSPINFWASIYCPGTLLANKLTESASVPIVFGTGTKVHACIAANNKYACSPANLTTCSDVSACAGKSCVEIPSGLCGQDAGGGGVKYSCNSNNQCVASATGTYTTTNCDNKCSTTPGKEQNYFFEILNPLKGGANDFTSLVKILAQWIFNLAIPIAVAMIVYSGILFLTAAGEPAKVTKARDVLKYAVIGLAIILIGSGFVTLIKSILELGGTGGTSTQRYSCDNNLCAPDPNGPFTELTCNNSCGGSSTVGEVGNKCSRDRDCSTGLKCRDSICQRATGNLVGEPCNSGSNCDIGLSCDKSGDAIQPIDGQTLGTCFVNSQLGGRIGDLCEKDSNCLSGLKCNQICQRRDGNLNGEVCLKTSSTSNCKSKACHIIGAEIIGDCVPYSGT